MREGCYVKITRPIFFKKKTIEEFIKCLNYNPEVDDVNSLYQEYSKTYDEKLLIYKKQLALYNSIIIKLSTHLTEEELDLCEHRWFQNENIL